jgi:hypothetical protein
MAEDISGGFFKGVTFYGSQNGQLTNSADVFLGWLKDKEASLNPGAMLSKVG